MKLLDLFAGVGGFSYAAHQLGWRTAAFVEKETLRHDALRKNFPGVPIFEDIFDFDGTPFRGTVGAICSGFPCQPFSHAGLRRGVNDERYLFPETLRVIREVEPAWIILENVAGLLSMANEVRDVKVGSRQYSPAADIDRYEGVYAREEDMLLHAICEGLEAEGYAIQPLVIPAAAREADHERYRVWIVGRRAIADAEHERRDDRGRTAKSGRSSDLDRRAFTPGRNGRLGRLQSDAGPVYSDVADDNPNRTKGRRQRNGICDIDRNSSSPERERNIEQPGPVGESFDAANIEESGHRGRYRNGHRGQRERGVFPNIEGWLDTPGKNEGRDLFANWLEAASELCGVVHGLPEELDASDVTAIGDAIKAFGREEVERTLGFDCSEIENRLYAAERISALGNAIYPDIALEIFKAIEAAENE